LQQAGVLLGQLESPVHEMKPFAAHCDSVSHAVPPAPSTQHTVPPPAQSSGPSHAISLPVQVLAAATHEGAPPVCVQQPAVAPFAHTEPPHMTPIIASGVGVASGKGAAAF
jgi:hypothetical protein